MPSFRIVSDVFSHAPWEFTDDKGQVVKLKSYYFEVQGGEDPARKVFLHQKPETAPPKEGDTLEGKITDKQNKKGTHNKFEKDKKFPPLKCPDCGHEGPLDDFRNPLGGSQSAVDASKPQTGTQQPSGDSEPPVSAYDDIPFP